MWVVLPVVFLGVAGVMAGPGELAARCFLVLPRLEAYRWDLVGSLLGIAAFSVASFLRAPSVVWGALVAVPTIALLGPSRRARLVAGAASVVVVGVLLAETLAPGVSWSPYYKVETLVPQGAAEPTTAVLVNGIPHQNIASLATRLTYTPRYALPYERTARASAGNVLVVGAGNGVDVAQALAHGATSWTRSRSIRGSSSSGPSSIRTTPMPILACTSTSTTAAPSCSAPTGQYDTIIFALPDSLTLVAGASQIRLESYLFTLQAMQAVHAHLTPDGIFAMYNSYREDWLVGRLQNTVAQAFGHAPCVDTIQVGQQRRHHGGARRRATSGAPPRTLGSTVRRPSPTTGRSPTCARPASRSSTCGRSPGSSHQPARRPGLWRPGGRSRPYVDLFFLGAAFMLLETRAVTGFALLFGTTWLVNAIVFAGVLVAVLLAVEATRALARPVPRPRGVRRARGRPGRRRRRARVVAARPAPGWRVLASVTVAFLPIFMANVVFASRFADTADATTAFGVNLLGAMVGGCLEYTALLIGYPALIGLAAILYLCAFLTGRRTAGGIPQVERLLSAEPAG